MTAAVWTDADRALRDWGTANGHPVMVTAEAVHAVAECIPCDWEARVATTSAATRVGLAHLASVQAAEFRAGGVAA